MNSDHLDALATWQQLVLFTFFAVGSVSLLAVSTYTGDSGIWDKLGDEMGKLNKAIKATMRTIRVAPMVLAHIYVAALDTARARHMGTELYAGRHRLA